MKLIDIYIRWNEPTAHFPAGQFVVTDGKPPSGAADLKNGFGIGHGGWSEVDDAERRRRLRLIFTIAVKHHGVSETVARAALAGVEDVEDKDVYFVQVDPSTVQAELGVVEQPG